MTIGFGNSVLDYFLAVNDKLIESLLVVTLQLLLVPNLN